MIVALDGEGYALPDVHVKEFVAAKLARQEDIHTSNLLVIMALRAALIVMPVEERPKIRWFAYGNEAWFDENMRSDTFWNDERVDLTDEFCSTVLGVVLDKKKEKVS